jgi:hypothetical protein
MYQKIYINSGIDFLFVLSVIDNHQYRLDMSR